MRITGFDAINFAEREGRTLNKLPDAIDEGREGLSIAEAEAIATESPELIYLDLTEQEYYGQQRNMEPER